MGFIGQRTNALIMGVMYGNSYRRDTAAIHPGCASGPVRPGTGRPDEQARGCSLDGPKIFRNYCAACHGVDGKGKGPVSGALKHAPPDLTSISQRNSGEFPADKVKAIIAGP